MYTPYVSVIRTDRYMMPHVIKQRGASATKVVNRLEDIPETVQSLLRHSEANKQYYRGHSQ
jgi:hypothetical protein